ncbi:NAD(P)-dependent alcohol dehydrogenase [Microbulbifer sp. OS29]|uniref:alcohol dehydrogenase (NADP(+)) n=1 Tax=Microbulbifer okhotskensis TaxID=2926617 RepID=A0A9X2J763_9GAMM|nr:NAD(P)-dependent alcohol dehydrogenase [Microbulbifer okhotskensis]MCO1336853.1 NAD(P)-dependent alcohol dehydrogenase [Microbulbifer okhotskensis]
MSTASTINAYAALEAGGPLQAYQIQTGDLGPTEVELEVMYCGICHSDLSMIDNEWGIGQYPMVAGHEVIGRVAAMGEQVSHLKKGTVVGLGWNSDYCETCHTCRTGDLNLCKSAKFTILTNGGFADRVRADMSSLVVIPEGVDPVSAGPLLCAGITVFNPLVQFDIKPTDKVAVIGIGGLGHIALKFLNAWGCEVTAFTSNEGKRKEALSLGAHKTLNSRDAAEIEAAVMSFDLIISTVNVSLDWDLYIQALKPKGRLHFVGALTNPIQFSLFPVLFGQRSISASPVGSPATIETMLEFVAHHKIKPEVEIFPMNQIEAAFEHLKSGKAKYRIVLSQEG